MEGTKLNVEQVGTNIRVARMISGYKTDVEFAKKLGMSKQNLSHRLVGFVKFKKKEKEMIAEVTGKSVVELFGLES